MVHQSTEHCPIFILKPGYNAEEPQCCSGQPQSNLKPRRTGDFQEADIGERFSILRPGLIWSKKYIVGPACCNLGHTVSGPSSYSKVGGKYNLN